MFRRQHLTWIVIASVMLLLLAAVGNALAVASGYRTETASLGSSSDDGPVRYFSSGISIPPGNELRIDLRHDAERCWEYLNETGQRRSGGCSDLSTPADPTAEFFIVEQGEEELLFTDPSQAHVYLHVPAIEVWTNVLSLERPEPPSSKPMPVRKEFNGRQVWCLEGGTCLGGTQDHAYHFLSFVFVVRDPEGAGYRFLHEPEDDSPPPEPNEDGLYPAPMPMFPVMVEDPKEMFSPAAGRGFVIDDEVAVADEATRATMAAMEAIQGLGIALFLASIAAWALVHRGSASGSAVAADAGSLVGLLKMAEQYLRRVRRVLLVAGVLLLLCGLIGMLALRFYIEEVLVPSSPPSPWNLDAFWLAGAALLTTFSVFWIAYYRSTTTELRRLATKPPPEIM